MAGRGTLWVEHIEVAAALGLGEFDDAKIQLQRIDLRCMQTHGEVMVSRLGQAVWK